MVLNALPLPLPLPLPLSLLRRRCYYNLHTGESTFEEPEGWATLTHNEAIRRRMEEEEKQADAHNWRSKFDQQSGATCGPPPPAASLRLPPAACRLPPAPIFSCLNFFLPQFFPAPVLLAPVLPAPVLPAPVLLTPVLPAPVATETHL